MSLKQVLGAAIISWIIIDHFIAPALLLVARRFRS